MLKIIAECGCNWNGNISNAFKMIKKAKEIGVDYVKFQIFKEEHIENHPKFKELKKMILDCDQIEVLYDAGKKIGIEVFFTPFFPEAIDWLEKIGVLMYKVRYLDQNNYQLYKRLKKTKKIFLISCQEPKYTLYSNIAFYQKNVRYLYCVPNYPAKYKNYFPLSTDFHGISDHTPDLGLLKFVAQNMTSYEYFEKHIKLDDDCIESNWSVSFEELDELIKKIKKIEVYE